MPRAFLFILDSFGAGGAPDAARFGDAGANTFGHIARACAEGRADADGVRSGPLSVPAMGSLGLGLAAATAGTPGTLPPASLRPGSFHGAAQEISSGKDTPSGHWEIAGCPVLFDWGYFPNKLPAFPEDLSRAIVAEGQLPGILGNCHASGTEIIERLGEAHVASGKPIVYTSVDSVIQIAAHETHFGLERLYRLCETVRRLADPLNIGRVIARPFTGETSADFTRTGNRRDYSVPPPEATLLDRVVAHGGRTFAVGKIADIFAHRGITDASKAHGNMAMFDAALAAIDGSADGDLVFVNFVDFDSEYGHRRDVAGYAAALEAFDRRLPEALSRLRAGDLLILSADHGNDPTWTGTDHTRERVPVIGLIAGSPGGDIGLRATFADIGETIAAHLGLPAGRHGASFLRIISPHA